MNQSNFDIGEVLKASLEKERPSVSFENIWSKYSEHKRPSITFKRMAILVAAILLVVVSKKYINSIIELPNNQGIVSRVEVDNSANDATANKSDLLRSNRVAESTMDKASKPSEKAALSKKAAQPSLFAATAEPSESFVVWNNNTYKKTMTVVSLKELGTKLGEIKNNTDKPQLNLEANVSPLGTALYVIKGEDSKKVIAVKIEGVYYRAINIEVTK